MNFLNQVEGFFRKLKRRQSSECKVGSSQQKQLQSEPEVGCSQQEQLESELEVGSSQEEHLQSESEVGSLQEEQLQSSQSDFNVCSPHESTYECLRDRNRVEDFDEYYPKPTFPYPKEHTIWFEYLGRYEPEPNWKRWLSPFHHKTPQNAFCRGITVKQKPPRPPVFFGKLSRAVKRRLSRGYRVGVLTPNHKFCTKVSLKDPKVGPEVRWGISYSMTFEDAGHGYWRSCGFDWGKTLYLDIWILLQRSPDRPISSTSITFLIQEPTLLRSRFCFETQNQYDCKRLSMAVEHAWNRFSEAVDRYHKKCRRRRNNGNISQAMWEERNNIIKDFRANFHYNILVPFREKIFYQWDLDGYGPPIKKIVRDPKFVDRFTKTLQTSQMIGSDLAIMPWAMSIWMTLQGLLNSKFEEIKVENWDVMFANPTKQDDVFDGNAPEVASFAISGDFRSNDPIAIDPAIESITYSVFLESIRDLPFKLNWWCQVVRRESKPIPFIRSSRFQCQMAYSAFATEMEADEEIPQRLELYRHLFEEILAVPVIKCKTIELEKFAVEVFLPNVVWSVGKRLKGFEGACSIRGATAHFLGQNGLENFNKNGEKATAWLNSWSCSMRVIGLMAMVHKKKNGLVLPPNIAPKQVIVTSRLEENCMDVCAACEELVTTLSEAGIRAKADLEKFPLSDRCWEDRGVPLLIKVGPEVRLTEQVEVFRRDTHVKWKCGEILPLSSIVENVKKILDEIQKGLFEAAKARQDDCIQTVKDWDEFVEAVHNMKVILAPWCDEEIMEKYVKAELGLMEHGYGVKILCTPSEQPEITEDIKCFASGKPAKKWTYWGRNLLDEFSK